jgi:alanine racemase
VSFVKRLGAGEGVAYGHTWVAPSDRWLATVPIGYADGVRRDLGHRGGHVLIGGVRRPIVGVVTMDQLVVDLGVDASVSVGDPVALIGSQVADTISAQEVADWLGTIPYEVVCAINPRVRREYSTT